MRSKHSQLYREKYERICDLYKQGWSVNDLGAEFNLSNCRINQILGIYKTTTERPKVITHKEYLTLENNRLRETLNFIISEELPIEEIKSLCHDALKNTFTT